MGSAKDTASQKVQDAQQYAADTAEYAKARAAETAEKARRSTEGTKHEAGKAYNKVRGSAPAPKMRIPFATVKLR